MYDDWPLKYFNVLKMMFLTPGMSCHIRDAGIHGN